MGHQSDDFNDLVEAERQFRSEHVNTEFNEMWADTKKVSAGSQLSHFVRSIVMIPLYMMATLRHIWLWIIIAIPVCVLLYAALFVDHQFGTG